MRFVQSNYRAKWKGIVLSTYPIRSSFPRAYNGVGYVVLVLVSANGQRMRKRLIRKLNKDWLTEIKPFDIEWVNKDWLKI